MVKTVKRCFTLCLNPANCFRFSGKNFS